MLQAVFINTDDKPLEVKRQGVFKSLSRGQQIYFYELCEVFYPHPEAPTEAKVSILNWLEVVADAGVDNLILFVNSAMRDIGKITKLRVTV